MAELGFDYETTITPRELVERGEFDSGIYACMAPDEFEIGDHITRRSVLPLSERALFSGEGSVIPVEERVYGEDTTVEVTGITGSVISVTDVFRIEGQVVLVGESRPYSLTPEGWMTPEGGLPVQAVQGLSTEELITGYFIKANSLAEQDEREAAAAANEDAEMAMARVLAVRASVGAEAVSRSFDSPQR